jgi:hypothetical protein
MEASFRKLILTSCLLSSELRPLLCILEAPLIDGLSLERRRVVCSITPAMVNWPWRSDAISEGATLTISTAASDYSNPGQELPDSPVVS